MNFKLVYMLVITNNPDLYFSDCDGKYLEVSNCKYPNLIQEIQYPSYPNLN